LYLLSRLYGEFYGNYLKNVKNTDFRSIRIPFIFDENKSLSIMQNNFNEIIEAYKEFTNLKTTENDKIEVPIISSKKCSEHIVFFNKCIIKRLIF